MKTYISETITKIRQLNEKLDSTALLTNKYWIYIDGILTNKSIYLFSEGNELTISLNGNVEKAKWQYLPNKRLLIERSTGSLLFQHNILFDQVLVLTIENRYAVFVNECLFDKGVNTITSVDDFLKSERFKEKRELYNEINKPTLLDEFNQIIAKNYWAIIIVAFIAIVYLLLLTRKS